MQPNGNMLRKLIHQYLGVGLLAYFEGIFERKMFERVGKRTRDGLGFEVKGRESLGAPHHQKEHEKGFSIKNSQTVVIFYAFLSALALACASFMLEIFVQMRPY